ncbi:MAG TPA: NAD(P)/FAD-dependent oxidoreductase [Gaiellales bacterium]|nr:NAD(P)/FAD-dependent oxidoreductase [Gaiellales bacterium]
MTTTETADQTRATKDEQFDVAIVGAGPAGLGAALILGRMRRKVLVLDTDAPAHAVSDGVHGFLAQDGTPPGELRAIGRDQLKPYASVQLRPLAARRARVDADDFELGLGDGTRARAARLLLAHGMRYELPDLDGISDVWARRVFHCPYCHGWEVRDQRVAVYGCSDRAVHQALLLASLTGDVVVLCEHESALAPDQLQHLSDAGIEIESRPVSRVEEHDGALRVAFASGDELARDALFIQPRLELASNLATSLGAVLSETGTVSVDEVGLSTVPGLYVAGDAATPVQSVAVATASGARAAYAINADLAIPRHHITG